MSSQTTSENNRFKNWFGESVLTKLFLIGVLILFLLIPSNWIQNLIQERQSRQNEVKEEIASKWSGSQSIGGPVMVIPYTTFVNQKDASGNILSKEIISNIYVLPEILNITSVVNPEILHRGIFDAVVYNTKIKVDGGFSALELIKSDINPEMIHWDKVKIVFGLSDLKGLKNNPIIKLHEVSYPVEPDFTSLKLFANNLAITPDLSEQKNTKLNFSFDIDLRGSSDLNFLHLGKTTNVKVQGNWKNPSFTGNYLPEERAISDTGFTSEWKIPYFNRPFSQQWVAENTTLMNKDEEACFGVKFILPVDQYQKTMRSAKYAILIILLTFLSLFFTELLNKKKVHLLQYILIGAAMTIYYTLLLSFSEQVGFNLAYLIASLATVTLIGLFIAALLKNKKPAIVFVCILSVFYGFIFIIIQLQDLALLFGSIGLFITVATTMYLSTRIDWTNTSITDTSKVE